MSGQLRTLEGRVGSGKTARVLEELSQAAQRGERAILLVPEQTTLQMEQMLAQKLSAPGFLLCEVLSPTRLVSRVLEAAGGLAGHTMIDERGRALALRASLLDLDGSLRVYRGCGGRQGFVEWLAELAQELSRNEQGATELRLAADALPDGLLPVKLYDLAALLDHYHDMLRGRYLDTSDAAELFAQRAGTVDFIRESRIWVDGFDIMPPTTLRLIAALAGAAREVTVALTLPVTDAPSDGLFDAVSTSLARLSALAVQGGIPMRRESLERRPYHSQEISHLESQWDAYPVIPYAHRPQEILLHSLPTPREEAEVCAARILSMMRSGQGLRFGQIAVAVGDEQTYAPLLRRAFAARKIPCFIPQEVPASAHPAAVYWLCAMEAATTGMRPEAVGRALRSGYAGIGEDEADRLDNLLLTRALRGKRWEQELADEPELEAARRTFVTPLAHFGRRGAKKQDARTLAHAAYLLLEEAGVYARLMAQIDALENTPDNETAQRNAQIWSQMTNALDQAVELLGERPITVREFLLSLRSALDTSHLATLPPQDDTVLVSSTTRMKGADVRVLFLLGVNDGILPAAGGKDGLLGLEERERINRAAHAQSLPLYLNGAIEQDQAERFSIYATLTLPTDKLYLSYARAGEDGATLRPSILISRLRTIFPKLAATGAGGEDVYDFPDTALWQAAARLRSSNGQDELARDVWHFLKNRPEYALHVPRIYEALVSRALPEPPLPAEVVSRLFRERVMGVTRIERFARCPYQHFVQNGLRPLTLYEPGVRPVDAGSFYHNALDAFVQAVTREGQGWDTLSVAQCDAYLTAAARPILEEYVQNTAPGRMQARAGELMRTVRKSARVLALQLQNSRFLPLHSEIAFGKDAPYPALTLPLAGGELLLEGRIDRVDACTVQGQRYVRVIDYKSGNVRLSPEALAQGLTLQLPLYAKVASQALEAAVAGLFYFKIADDLIDIERGDATREMAARHKLSGVLLEDIEVAMAMDEGLEEGSIVLPAALTKSRAFHARSSVLPGKLLGNVMEDAEKTATALATRLYSGEIAPKPALLDKKSACEHCDFASICRYNG